jgi:hypothetical protein
MKKLSRVARWWLDAFAFAAVCFMVFVCLLFVASAMVSAVLRLIFWGVW